MARYEGRTYKHFTGAMATTSFVFGEFPWRVTVGEQVLADDYIDPPRLLSSETTNDEVTWSQGEYIPGAEHLESLQPHRRSAAAAKESISTSPLLTRAKYGASGKCFS